MKNLSFLAASLLVIGLSEFIPSQAAEIYYNANIYTADKRLEYATAFVVDKGKFIYVGNDKKALSYQKDKTKDTVTDLNGARVLPGFIESHNHLTTVGASSPSEDAIFGGNIKSRQELMKIGKEFAQKRKDLSVIMLREIPQEYADLTMKDWDEICKDRPVFVIFEGGHAGAVNTLMAEKIDLEHQKDPMPGVSYAKRDKDGHVTGYIAELIMTHMMFAKGIPLDKEQAKNGLENIIHYYNSMGYTGVTEGGTPNLNENEILPILKELDEEGKYTLHNDFPSIWFGNNICTIEEYEKRVKYQKKHFETENIKIGTIKMWADGVLGAHSALMRQPYNEPSGKTNYGSHLISIEDQHTAAKLAKKNGWNIHIHSIGDKAVENTLDVYEAVGKTKGVKSIAHYEICDEDLMDRTAKMNIPVATTPWWASTMQKAEFEGAGKKLPHMLDIAGLMDRGINVSFGSDSNGSPAQWNPVFNIYTAMVRRPDAPKNGPWIAGKPISAKQAIDAYTINGAIERGHEKEFGSITKGKSADFVIWNKDLMILNPKEMLTYHEKDGSFDLYVWPLKTYFRGKCVFDKNFSK